MDTTAHTTQWIDALTADIISARASITITALSFLPPRTMKIDAFTRFYLAIIDAAARHVSVQVALPAPTLAHPATIRNEHAAATLRAAGIAVALVPSTNLLHAKTICIDNAIAWIGSGNFTAAAAHHNREAYLRTIDPRAVLHLQGFTSPLTSTAQVAS